MDWSVEGRDQELIKNYRNRENHHHGKYLLDEVEKVSSM